MEKQNNTTEVKLLDIARSYPIPAWPKCNHPAVADCLYCWEERVNALAKENYQLEAARRELIGNNRRLDLKIQVLERELKSRPKRKSARKPAAKKLVGLKLPKGGGWKIARAK